MNFNHAIVRIPSDNFADGLTSGHFGVPDVRLALEQHADYCAALERCGCTLTRLRPDPQHPDSTFIEDNAVVTSKVAISTRSATMSRAGEVQNTKASLHRFFSTVAEISEPGTVDGGDVCMADKHFFIGLSARTNEAGAVQLKLFLGSSGYTSSMIDIRKSKSLLHLKSGVAYLGDRRLVLTEAIADLPEFKNYDRITVASADEYAANCLRVNDYVLIASGYPALEEKLTKLGYQTIPLSMSEFQKMDGGLSCLSLRF